MKTNLLVKILVIEYLFSTYKNRYDDYYYYFIIGEVEVFFV